MIAWKTKRSVIYRIYITTDGLRFPIRAVQISPDVIDLRQGGEGAKATEIAEPLGRSKGTIDDHVATLGRTSTS